MKRKNYKTGQSKTTISKSRKTNKVATKQQQSSSKTVFKGGVENGYVGKSEWKRKRKWKRKMDECIGIGNLDFICLGFDRLRRKKDGTGEQFYGRI